MSHIPESKTLPTANTQIVEAQRSLMKAVSLLALLKATDKTDTPEFDDAVIDGAIDVISSLIMEATDMLEEVKAGPDRSAQS